MRRCPSMSTILLNGRKTVAFASLTALLLIATVMYTRRNKFHGNMAWLVSQPLSNLQFWHSCATTSLTRPDAARGVTAQSVARLPSSPLRNFTVVTAYFNIETSNKGSQSNKRRSSTYLDLMGTYQFIQNGVVAYFDDASMAAAFTELRRDLPTRVIVVDRSKLWAFSLLERTRAVLSQPDYPQNYLKPYYAEYVAAMHAKYELVARAIREGDSFGSSYVAWMDFGSIRKLFRDTLSQRRFFMLRANPCLHDEAVMYARMHPIVNGHTVEAVMQDGIDWVSGNVFVARRRVLIQFCDEYMQSVESYLKRGLANHDQSVVLAMYLPGSAPRPSVPLQAIIPSGSDDPWLNMALQQSHRDALEAPGGGQQMTSCKYEMYT